MGQEWEVCKLLQAYGDLLRGTPSAVIDKKVGERIQELIAELSALDKAAKKTAEP